jgi:hypothetical protein
MHRDGERDGKLQFRSHLVCQSHEHGNNHQHWGLYSCGSGNCDHHRDLDRGPYSIRSSDSDGDSTGHDHVRGGFMLTHKCADRANQPMFSHRYGHWKL